jgi:hypothetical protein
MRVNLRSLRSLRHAVEGLYISTTVSVPPSELGPPLPPPPASKCISPLESKGERSNTPLEVRVWGAQFGRLESSVADPDPNPSDPYVFGPPGSGSGSIIQRYGSGAFYHKAKIVRKTLIPNAL